MNKDILDEFLTNRKDFELEVVLMTAAKLVLKARKSKSKKILAIKRICESPVDLTFSEIVELLFNEGYRLKLKIEPMESK